MRFFRHHRNSPLFLWITLVATTALLIAVVVVEIRSENGPSEEVVEFIPTDLERQYSEHIVEQITAYKEAVIDFDVSEDSEEWLEVAQVLHDELIAIPVPQRMQTLHLNAVLQMSQVITALKQENTGFLSTHRTELDTILAALSYE